MSNINVASWNIAAINNNPFEYWITYPDKTYDEFMLRVEQIISSQAELLGKQIFTENMFSELMEELDALNFGGLESLEDRWAQDLSHRTVVHGFLNDRSLGEKRLTSMPDRITNTINLIDGKYGTKITGPTVINSYERSSLHSVEKWWEEWKHFMFPIHM